MLHMFSVCSLVSMYTMLKFSQLMQNMFGDTALFAACSQGRLDTAAVLIKHGATVNNLNKVRSLCVHGQHVW